MSHPSKRRTLISPVKLTRQDIVPKNLPQKSTVIPITSVAEIQKLTIEITKLKQELSTQQSNNTDLNRQIDRLNSQSRNQQLPINTTSKKYDLQLTDIEVESSYQARIISLEKQTKELLNQRNDALNQLSQLQLSKEEISFAEKFSDLNNDQLHMAAVRQQQSDKIIEKLEEEGSVKDLKIKQLDLQIKQIKERNKKNYQEQLDQILDEIEIEIDLCSSEVAKILSENHLPIETELNPSEDNETAKLRVLRKNIITSQRITWTTAQKEAQEEMEMELSRSGLDLNLTKAELTQVYKTCREQAEEIKKLNDAKELYVKQRLQDLQTIKSLKAKLLEQESSKKST